MKRSVAIASLLVPLLIAVGCWLGVVFAEGVTEMRFFDEASRALARGDISIAEREWDPKAPGPPPSEDLDRRLYKGTGTGTAVATVALLAQLLASVYLGLVMVGLRGPAAAPGGAT